MEFMQWRRFECALIMAVFLLVGVGTSSLNAQEVIKTDTVSLGEGNTFQEVFPFPGKKIHSPHKATFYSAILPGLGQAYNKKYWKIPIIYGVIGSMAYAIHFNSTNYTKYKNAYRDFLIQDPGNKSYADILPPTLTVEDVEGQYAEWFEQALENKRDYYRRYRDLSYIGMVAIYVLNLIDASVDAHFYDFDVSDDLSLNVQPVIMAPTPYSNQNIGIRLSFNF
ncbi:hypothetical protein SAMN05444380_101203 [Thermophagus xiamenensis]|uniref:DUF5683 domain-containing protein n=2 Tax=Thermophagus xiamenensis TaxID=385682 RepID=A0A1I1UUI1_9BACT|nr:hypothetical protein SAMN05444380_101203 [Thermophagus xiamenensis]